MTTQLDFVNIISEITQVICPGSLSLHLSRFDSPDNNPHPTVYSADKDYFRIHPTRKLLLREAVEGEFDLATPSSDAFFPEEYPTLKLQKAEEPGEILRMVRSRIPRLWVLVTKLGPNTHQVVTVYRGKGLWKTIDQEARDIAVFESDAVMLPVLDALQRCEGTDKKEWEAFIQLCWQTYVSTTAKQTRHDWKN